MEASNANQNMTNIQGSYGTALSENVIDLTDPKLYHAYKPVIVTSTSYKATVKAAAAWCAIHLTTGNEVIQVATLTGLGWSGPMTLSFNDGTDKPSKDYKITMSDDGKVIVVCWSSTFPSMLDSIACSAVSTNGGLTWSGPEKLQKMTDSLAGETQTRFTE